MTSDKWWCDDSIENRDYLTLSKFAFDITSFNLLESCFIETLGFNISVNRSLYTKT